MHRLVCGVAMAISNLGAGRFRARFDGSHRDGARGNERPGSERAAEDPLGARE